MQAHNLKDILKSTYPFGYNENYYGVPDPYGMQVSVPNMSSSIKVYINNQELTTGLYGSGLVIYGDMDIDFVDHIEVYSGNPTFEFSTEPAFTIIKLYTKSAQKDEGSKLLVGLDSRGSNRVAGYNIKELENGWSYLAYASTTKDNRKKYENYNAELSKDKTVSHVVGTFSNENNTLLLDAFTSKRDAFASQSIFLTPETSQTDTNYLHMGYDGKWKNFSFIFEYDMHNMESNFRDANEQLIQNFNAKTNSNIPYQIKSHSDSQTYTTGIKHKYITKNNTLLSGVKYRYKHFKYTTLQYNDHDLPSQGHTSQTTASIFVENQYSLAKNQIITTGANFSQVTNNVSIQDDNLYGVRLGYTYTNDKLISKTIYSHLEMSIDPYLVGSIYLANPEEKTPPTKYEAYLQNIIYNFGTYEVEAVGSYIISKNQLCINQDLKLTPNKKDMGISSLLLRYTLEYNKVDTLEISTGYNHMTHVLNVSNAINQYAMTFRSLNTYRKFDIFNEFLAYRDNMTRKYFVDYSAGVKYHINENLNIAFKGTNIFNRAKESNYMRLNPETLKMDEPLSISPIDQTFMLTMGYTF
jgi:iron complex outermembrane receptor protein